VSEASPTEQQTLPETNSTRLFLPLVEILGQREKREKGEKEKERKKDKTPSLDEGKMLVLNSASNKSDARYLGAWNGT
jgi:hypothetical protein